MTWTYTPETGDDISRVRLLIGDTNPDDEQMQDEEIQMLLDTEGGVQVAAQKAAFALAAKYARLTDKWVGDLKILASQRARRYQELYQELKTALASGALYAVPTAGGVYVADKDAQAANEALTQGSFRRDMHDNTDSVN